MGVDDTVEPLLTLPRLHHVEEGGRVGDRVGWWVSERVIVGMEGWASEKACDSVEGWIGGWVDELGSL